MNPERGDAAASPRLVSLAVPPQISFELDGTTVRISWPNENPGDFNLDGVANGHDLFLLAAHFNETVEDSPGNECIDMTGDGLLNGHDMFLLAANYLTRIDGFDVFLSDTNERDFYPTPINEERFAYVGCGIDTVWEEPASFGRSYYWAVRAWDEERQDYGPFSNAVYHSDPPVAPTGLQAVEVHQNLVELSWDEAEDIDYFYSKVYRAPSSAGPWERINEHQTERVAWCDFGTNPGETYYYAVSSMDIYNIEGPLSEPLRVEFQTSGWNFKTVPEDAHYLMDGPVIDSEGDTTVLLRSVEQLYLARYKYRKWNVEEVPAEMDELTWGTLDFTEDGSARVLCDGAAGLKYLSQDGDDWTSRSVNFGGHVQESVSAALDEDGYYRAAFFKDSGNFLAWARQTSESGWVITNIISTWGQWHPYTETVLSATGDPFVLFRKEGESDALGAAWRRAEEWEVFAIEEGNMPWHRAQAVFLADGAPMVVYLDDNNNLLKQAVFDGIGFVVEVLDSDLSNAFPKALAVDSTGRAFLCVDPLLGDYNGWKFGADAGEGWTFDWLNRSSSIGPIGLTVDPGGNPVVAIQSNKALWVAWWQP